MVLSSFEQVAMALVGIAALEVVGILAVMFALAEVRPADGVAVLLLPPEVGCDGFLQGWQEIQELQNDLPASQYVAFD